MGNIELVMLKQIASLAGLGLALGLSCANSASADVIATVTYTGEASSVFDPTGLFGAPSANLFGGNFVDVFKVDLNDGFLIHFNFSGTLEDQVLGGTTFDATTPIVSSNLTINGKTVEFSGDAVGQEGNEQGIFINSDAQSGAGAGESGFSSINTITMQTNAPLSLSTNYSGGPIAPNSFSSSFNICNLTAITPNESVCFADDETLNGFLTPETVNVAVTDAVPEPASWALMILGLGGVGSALRSRIRGRAAEAI